MNALIVTSVVALLGASAPQGKLTPEQLLETRSIPTDVESLLIALDNPDGVIREAAAYALGKHAGAKVTAALEAKLQDSDTIVRIAAAESLLSSRSSAPAHKALISALDDPDEASQARAVIALCDVERAKKKEPRALARLEQLMGAQSWTTRRAAVLGVVSCRAGKERVEALEKMISDPTGYVRAAAVEQLARLKDRSTLPYFVDLLSHDDEVLRFAANDALEKMTGQHFFYSHVDPPEERAKAIAKWRAWLKGARR